MILNDIINALNHTGFYYVNNRLDRLLIGASVHLDDMSNDSFKITRRFFLIASLPVLPLYIYRIGGYGSRYAVHMSSYSFSSIVNRTRLLGCPTLI